MVVEFINGKLKIDPHRIGPKNENQGGWRTKYWNDWNDIKRLQNEAKTWVGKTHIVNSVTLTNRADCCERRLTNIGVYTCEFGKNWTYRGKVNGYVGKGKKYTVKFSKPVPSIGIELRQNGEYLQFTGIAVEVIDE